MAGQILALFAHHFSQPFLDVGVADIIVVAPALVAGVVGRVIYYLNPLWKSLCNTYLHTSNTRS